MAEIRIDYQLVINKAKKIKELSREVEKISRKMGNLREDTEVYWKGQAATTYRSECEKLERYLQNVDNKMDTLANAIIRIANLIREADEASARAASNITTGN